MRDLESKVRVFSDTVVIAVSCTPLPEEQTSPLSPEETAVAVSVKLACSMASRFVGKAGAWIRHWSIVGPYQQTTS